MMTDDWWTFPSYQCALYQLGRLAKGARTRFILLKDQAGEPVAAATMGPGKQSPGFKHIFKLYLSDKMTDAYLDTIFIRPEYRKQGLGKWFVEVMTRQARQMGFTRVIADALNPTSHGLLEKMGFSSIGHYKNHAYMVKSLDAQV